MAQKKNKLRFFASLVVTGALLSVGCAHAPTYVTSHGINVYCESSNDCFSKEAVEYTTEELIDQLVNQVPDKFSREKIMTLLSSQVQWHSLRFVHPEVGPVGSCPVANDPSRRCLGLSCDSSPSGWCSGVTYTNVGWGGFVSIDMQVANTHECIAATALTHELIHFFHRLVLKTGDGEHMWFPYWPTACFQENSFEQNECKSESVNRVVDWNVCKQYCGDLCQDG